MTGRPSSSYPPSRGRSAAPGTQRADERGLCLLRPGSAGDGQHRRVDPLLEVGRAADQAILARTHFPLSPVPRCPGETCVTPFRARRRAAHCNGWYQESWVCAPCVTLAPDSPRIPSRYARVPLCQPSQTSTLRNGHRSADGRDGSPGRAAPLMAFHPTRTWCCRPASAAAERLLYAGLS
jgi:hypothetical protein